MSASAVGVLSAESRRANRNQTIDPCWEIPVTNVWGPPPLLSCSVRDHAGGSCRRENVLECLTCGAGVVQREDRAPAVPDPVSSGVRGLAGGAGAPGKNTTRLFRVPSATCVLLSLVATQILSGDLGGFCRRASVRETEPSGPVEKVKAPAHGPATLPLCSFATPEVCCGIRWLAQRARRRPWGEIESSLISPLSHQMCTFPPEASLEPNKEKKLIKEKKKKD